MGMREGGSKRLNKRRPTETPAFDCVEYCYAVVSTFLVVTVFAVFVITLANAYGETAVVAGEIVMSACPAAPVNAGACALLLGYDSSNNG